MEVEEACGTWQCGFFVHNVEDFYVFSICSDLYMNAPYMIRRVPGLAFILSYFLPSISTSDSMANRYPCKPRPQI